jgi:BirA family biotin operon repressor/biotin-[acetyl-CoA-carboxylase] ligase
MSTKDEILKCLEKNKGKPLSGSSLAKELGLSRSAIWKTIEALRKQGYVINAVTNQGYTLSVTNDIISKEGILLYLENKTITGDNLHVYNTVESTNQLAKKLAIGGALHGTVVLADEQTKGRGRLGRSFFSPKGSGIYMSIILRPTGTAEQALQLTTSAAVAVCKALSDILRVKASIKWVNDIYIKDKKICGILTEAVTNIETGSIESLILGVGINVFMPSEGFPGELNTIADSIFYENNLEGFYSKNNGQRYESFSRNRLIAAILDQIIIINQKLQTNPKEEFKNIIDEYRSRCFILNRAIRVHRGNQEYKAIARNIDSAGGLVIEKSDGKLETLRSGEISIRFDNM